MNIFRIRYETNYKYDQYAFVMAPDKEQARSKLLSAGHGFDAVTDIICVDLWNDIVYWKG